MAKVKCLIIVLALLLAWVPCQSSYGQLINTSTPSNRVGSSFFENNGVKFGFNFRGGSGPGSRVVGLDSLGNFSPFLGFSFGNGQLGNNGNLNFGSQGRIGNANLGLNFSRGSRRSSNSVTPSLTTQNGSGGSLNSSSIRPFVTSVVPVIGHGGTPLVGTVYSPARAPIENGVTRALNSGQLNLNGPISPKPAPTNNVTPTTYNPLSSATQGARSVAAIKAEREQRIDAERAKVQEVVDQADALVDRRQLSEARSMYRKALGLTDDKALRAEINRVIKSTRQK